VCLVRYELGFYIPEDDMLCYVRVEVFTAVTMKKAVVWGVALCGSCKKRRLLFHR
jgi:hypothetical protein